jgi:hypothetical protein
MLESDHPLLPLIGRLRLYLTQQPRTEDHAGTQKEYELLLVDLQNGLFDRLPDLVVEAVRRHSGNLHPSLDAAFVDIALYVRDGDEPHEDLIASFRVRLNHHHPAPDSEPTSSKIIFLDKPG